MLPKIGGPKPQDQIHIKSYPDEAEEIMHGIGLRLSSHLEHGGETSFKGACGASAELAAKEKGMFVATKDNYSKLERIFGDPIKKMMSTDIADASYPRECHHLPFPCAKDGSRCMTRDMFFVAMADANRQFCDRYTGPNGGLEATRLSISPFMKEIKEALFSSVSNDKINKKITIFSGHDTVIAPVLAALGVYRQKDLCVWPPYASRIVFEVYVKANAATSSFTVDQAKEEVMIRVLYNGLDVTKDIEECGKVMKDKTPLCPLGAIANQVDNLIFPFTSIDEACKESSIDALLRHEATTTTTTTTTPLKLSSPVDIQKNLGAIFISKYVMNHPKAIVSSSGLVFDQHVVGTGLKASISSKVTVHYHGTLIDGTVFDSSMDRKEPVSFSLSSVIFGWQEGVSLMSKGSKATLIIPSSLAYGDEGSDPQIPGGATLVFEIELLDIK